MKSGFSWAGARVGVQAPRGSCRLRPPTPRGPTMALSRRGPFKRRLTRRVPAPTSQPTSVRRPFPLPIGRVALRSRLPAPPANGRRSWGRDGVRLVLAADGRRGARGRETGRRCGPSGSGPRIRRRERRAVTAGLRSGRGPSEPLRPPRPGPFPGRRRQAAPGGPRGRAEPREDAGGAAPTASAATARG